MYYSNVHQLPFASFHNITVSGNGNVVTHPNYVQLQVEVSTKGTDLSGTQQENANIMRGVIQSIVALNIPRESIQTANYNIVPTYDYIAGEQIFKGYEVTNAITVKITDKSQAGTVIDTAVQNGANRISGIQFKLENADYYYQQALVLALQNAQMKAKTIAETMNFPLNPQPLEIVEEKHEEPVLFRSVAVATQNVSTPIEPGQMTISATVRVKFQY